MSCKKKKYTNFIVIQPWMFGNLKLSCNEATVFAIIYGFSQDGKSWYRGGSSYIEQVTPFTQRTAKTHLATLEELGVIELKKEVVNGVERNSYRAVPDVEELIIPDRKSDKKDSKSFKQIVEKPTGEKFSPVKDLHSDQGKTFTSTGENFSRKKYIEKTIGKSINHRDDALMIDGTPTEWQDVMDDFRERLELDILAERYDPAMLEELLNNIVEMYCCPQETQTIGQYPQTTVSIRKRLDKLTSQHIEYIMDALANTKNHITNIKAYLRMTILNAPITMEHYYQAQGNSIIANPSKSSTPAGYGMDALMKIQTRLKHKKAGGADG